MTSGINALLNGVERMRRRAVLQRIADRRITGRWVVRSIVVHVDRILGIGASTDAAGRYKQSDSGQVCHRFPFHGR